MNAAERARVVLFDLDGTLVDTAPDIVTPCQKTAAASCSL
jgi:phosphoglycolate phosphatase-like HAD superfamily hydrolase